MESLYSALTVIGPILLLAVLAYAIMRNRKVSSSETARTERATHELRDEIEAENHKDHVQR